MPGAGTTAVSGCIAPWTWHNLYLGQGVNNGSPFFPALGPTGQVLEFNAVVDGYFSVEWTPNPLPITSECSGNTTFGAQLAAGGDYDNLWLMQTAQPNTFNFLLRSDSVTQVVPASGLCVGSGGGTIHRLYDSLSLGGEPFRFPYNPSLAGTTQYSQAWYRTAGGGSETGEAIGVFFP